MTHTRTGFAASVVALLAMFSACADAIGQSGPTKTLVVGLDSEPITLNAHANSEAKALQIGHLTTCFLTSLNDLNGGPIQPGVATSWEYVSPTEVLFHLRDDVKFHNGRQLTSDDIVFTINWTQNLDNGSIHRNKSLLVDRAEKSGDFDVTIHLKSPYPPLIELLAYYPIIAEDTIDTLDTAPVGCGPFKFVRWDRDQQILFETNKEYYGGSIAFDELVLRVFQDYNAEMTAFLAGEVDIFQFLSSVDIPTVEARSDRFNVQSIDDYGYYLSHQHAVRRTRESEGARGCQVRTRQRNARQPSCRWVRYACLPAGCKVKPVLRRHARLGTGCGTCPPGIDRCRISGRSRAEDQFGGSGCKPRHRRPC